MGGAEHGNGSDGLLWKLVRAGVLWARDLPYALRLALLTTVGRPWLADHALGGDQIPTDFPAARRLQVRWPSTVPIGSRAASRSSKTWRRSLRSRATHMKNKAAAVQSIPTDARKPGHVAPGLWALPLLAGAHRPRSRGVKSGWCFRGTVQSSGSQPFSFRSWHGRARSAPPFVVTILCSRFTAGAIATSLIASNWAKNLADPVP
jgi:hypothetical protein